MRSTPSRLATIQARRQPRRTYETFAPISDKPRLFGVIEWRCKTCGQARSTVAHRTHMAAEARTRGRVESLR